MGALDGLRVLDFGWAIAVPLATKTLAEHGATVVRVESTQRLDIFRSYLIFANGKGVNRCVFYGQYNNDKYGITLNLNHPGSRPIIERLVRWADITVENFVPGTLERWQLGPADLRRLNPRLVLIRASLFGQTGPYAKQGGFGTMMQAIAGFTQIVGWPDRPPVGAPTPYTDWVSPWQIISLGLAALERRDRTSEGSYFDLSQMEVGLHYLSPALLDAAANGRALRPAGNRHRAAAPHGVFRCLGSDRWCAIAVHDDAQWQGLCTALGQKWCRESKFSTLLGRKQHEDELEQRIAEWTAERTPEEVMARLQAFGVPCGRVDNGKDNLENPQLNHREHFVGLQHQEMGEFIAEAPASRFSETPHVLRRASPCLGEHTEYVCREILGLSDEEFLAALTDGVLE